MIIPYYVPAPSGSTWYLPVGGVIDFGGGDVTLTHSSNVLTLAGGMLNLPDGSVSVPALGWASDADGSGTGLYRRGANIIGFSTNGSGEFEISSGAISFISTTRVGWSSSTLGNAQDVSLLRDAAATLQLGQDAASPTAQVFKGPDGSGTDRPGGDITLRPGNGTGTGVGGTFKIQTTPASAGSASTQNTPVDRITVTGAGVFSFTGASNGQAINLKHATTTVSSSASPTLTATNLIPAGSLVLGVTVRVTTAFGVTNGLTSFSVGDGTDADRWGATVGITLNTTTSLADITITSPVYYAAATSVVLTGAGDGGNEFDGTGVVRITVHYLDLTAATS